MNSETNASHQKKHQTHVKSPGIIITYRDRQEIMAETPTVVPMGNTIAVPCMTENLDLKQRNQAMKSQLPELGE